jgi:hypothetical protein
MEPNATMKVYLAAGLAAALVAFSSGHGQAQSTSIGATRKETTVKARATGTFDVKVTPLPADEHASTGEFARLSARSRAPAAARCSRPTLRSKARAPT